jgi:hypothetical protein
MHVTLNGRLYLATLVADASALALIAFDGSPTIFLPL